MIDLQGRKIAVLMGGPGNERKVSLASGAGVAQALRGLGAEVTEVDVAGPTFVLPAGTEVAFNVIHGTFGEDGQVQRILEARGVRYTGEGVAGSELAIDKIATKQRLLEHGVPTAAFEILRDGAPPTLPLPYVVKAPREGSSVGVFIVRDEGKVADAMREAWQFGRELLVEQFIRGRELTVGIIGEQALPVVEIRPKKDGEFYDFANKYNVLNPQAAGAEHFCPAPLSPAVRANSQRERERDRLTYLYMLKDNTKNEIIAFQNTYSVMDTIFNREISGAERHRNKWWGYLLCNYCKTHTPSYDYLDGITPILAEYFSNIINEFTVQKLALR